MPACLQALTHIAQKLEQLHASGWVHRAIKPGNILRLPQVHGWTFMDFGCAARTGAPPPGSGPDAIAESGRVDPRVGSLVDSWVCRLLLLVVQLVGSSCVAVELTESPCGAFSVCAQSPFDTFAMFT